MGSLCFSLHKGSFTPSPVALKFFLLLVFIHLITVFLSVVFFVYCLILLSPLDLWAYGLKKFCPLFLQIFFCHLLSVYSLSSFCIFPLCASFWIFSVAVFSNQLPSLLLIPSSVFFILDYVFFISRNLGHKKFLPFAPQYLHVLLYLEHIEHIYNG